MSKYVDAYLTIDEKTCQVVMQKDQPAMVWQLFDAAGDTSKISVKFFDLDLQPKAAAKEAVEPEQQPKEAWLVADQRDKQPQVAMSDFSGKPLCMIPNGESLLKMGEREMDYLVHWNGFRGLVKKHDAQPLLQIEDFLDETPSCQDQPHPRPRKGLLSCFAICGGAVSKPGTKRRNHVSSPN
jgi:hypothetical protein